MLGCSGYPGPGVYNCIFIVNELIFCLTNPVEYGTIRYSEKRERQTDVVDTVKAR